MQGPVSDVRAHSPIRTGTGSIGPADVRARGYLIYPAAVFAAAFLIFLVQPMVGKRILPWFGGVPAVWTLCLAFYQTALFAGYAYAHSLARFAPPRVQLAVHAVVIGLAWLALPVLPVTPVDLVSDREPTGLILRILLASVALPFVALAATGPIVQVWYARAHPERSPYVLYAVSNAGSLLALFAYPFLIEPRLSLPASSDLFGLGFTLTGLAILACGAFALRRSPGRSDSNVDPVEARPASVRARAVAHLWLGLSATAVVVLMGVTNELCLEIASLPFLWIVPLATYLATFIAAFASERAYRRAPCALLALAAFLATRMLALDDSIVLQTLAYCALLFGVCMLLHGELYRSRPPAAALTRFYLWVSAGGALGGLFAGIAAPRLFDTYAELPIGLLLTTAAVLSICARDAESFLSARGPLWRWATIGPFAVAFVGYFLWTDLRPEPGRVHQERSFFGVLRVDEPVDDGPPRRLLTSGTTVHGVQLMGIDERRLPTAYYGRITGLGLTLMSRPRDLPWRIGVVGLGAGTLAAYGRKGDQIRFYEIDPAVARLAGEDGPFTFVQDSPAEVEVVLGDARRSLEAEQRKSGSQSFDLLVLDAFTSDAIPIHLMTGEAFERYFEALAPGGLIAVHVSNRHFDLMSLVSRRAAESGAHSLQIQSAPIPEYQSDLADWVIITRDADDLTRLRIRIEKRISRLGLPPGSTLIRRGSDLELDEFPLWSDDYSDLLRVIRWR